MPAAPGVEALPDFPLDPAGDLAPRLLGLGNFRAAALHVRNLPYGRNRTRSDYGLVLEEARGTCSTKHALLAALAAEHDAPVELRLGIYQMNAGNTPAVGPVLSSFGLRDLPEAHCYLAYRGKRVDLTVPGAGAGKRFVHEETIRPDQIGSYKVEAHRAFLRAWAADRNLDPASMWLAREECIAALSRLGDA